MLHSCCHREIHTADSSFWEAIPHACFSYSSATLISAGSLAWKPSDCQCTTPFTDPITVTRVRILSNEGVTEIAELFFGREMDKH